MNSVLTKILRCHAFVKKETTVDFFDGMILGNGDVGAAACVRPDGLLIFLGKNDAWDRHEGKSNKAKSFSKLKGFWQELEKKYPHENSISETVEWKEYIKTVREPYSLPYPRPVPVGKILIKWEPNLWHLEEQRLDIATGKLCAALTCGRIHQKIELFICREKNVLVVEWPDSGKQFVEDIQISWPQQNTGTYERQFLEIEKELNKPIGFTQILYPDQHYRDGFRIDVKAIAHKAISIEQTDRSLFIFPGNTLTVGISTTRDIEIGGKCASDLVIEADAKGTEALFSESIAGWEKEWQHSRIELEDKELERIWYHNQYFLSCCLKPGVVCPGLFGPWVTEEIGTIWHGDYHMNYNLQQLFWTSFSSNRLHQHEPYMDVILNWRRVAHIWAEQHYGARGLKYPLVLYPVKPVHNPYPVPPWEYCMCLTAWCVQSFWWHYLYSGDIKFLKDTAYPLLKEAMEFYEDILVTGSDGHLHIPFTVSPEHHGFTRGFELNKDCILDIALIQFLLKALIKASEKLACDTELREKWCGMLEKLCDYPVWKSPSGRRWVDVTGLNEDIVYNIPITVTPVFPGDQVTLSSDPKTLEIARNTLELIRCEGMNDLVFLNIQRARLGMLNFEHFKQEVRECLLGNGACYDRVRCSGGRQSDDSDYDWLKRVGIWTENFSLPAVINECLLQSAGGVIRVFPNSTGLCPASFHNLRTEGAFLVNAKWDGTQVTDLVIKSECGGLLSLINPWPGSTVRVLCRGKEVPVHTEKNILQIKTESGQSYAIGRI